MTYRKMFLSPILRISILCLKILFQNHPYRFWKRWTEYFIAIWLITRFRFNELPSSKLRGILTEQHELLTMQFLILFFPTLLFHIFHNTLLIAKLPNRVDEITLRPKLPAQRAFFADGTRLKISCAVILLIV